MAKHILLFGAGKSATVLIDYLKDLSNKNGYNVTVADEDVEAARLKAGAHDRVKALQVNVLDEDERQKVIESADVVISLLPPSLHYLVALDCIQFSKHLLTASYIDERIKELRSEIAEKKLLFLCEMGLDPGIDHMSAMKLIHNIKASGATITSFKSHCGGLVAPEDDTNPWRYKISWNPRNVVTAGQAGAVYKEGNEVVRLDYHQLFNAQNRVNITGELQLAYYPNRDSLSYISTYQLDEAKTFMRTTLRHPDFCFGWKNIIALHLTDETHLYDTNGLSISNFLKLHVARFGISNWQDELKRKLEQDESIESNKSFNSRWKLALEQLNFLGLTSDELINRGKCSAAQVLQFILEKKLALQPLDKDLVVMMHEIEYETEGKKETIKSSLIVKGENASQTAMAKTVGLPLGITAKLILEEKLAETGLHIPVIPSIYEPVLKELRNHGISFIEEIV